MSVVKKLGTRIIVVMGVCGSGKSTVGAALAKRIGYRFVDADDFHSQNNIRKMSEGTALTEKDRKPWLEAIRSELEIRIHKGESIILACSSLKQEHRMELSPRSCEILWVALVGEIELLVQRVKNRQGHFMKENMLHEQVQILNVPENALVCDIASSVPSIVEQIVRYL